MEYILLEVLSSLTLEARKVAAAELINLEFMK